MTLMHDRLLRVGAAVVGVAAITLASACAQVRSQQTASSGPASQTQPAVNVQVIESQADEIYLQIWGNATQKEAGNYLSHRALNDPITACMHTAGFAYESPFETLWEGYRPHGTAGQWMGPFQIRQSDRALANAASLRYESSPPSPSAAHNTAEYIKAVNDCINTSAGNPEPVDRPDGTDLLAADYTKMILSVDIQLGPTGRYTDCMVNQGFDVGGIDEDGREALGVFLRSSMPTPPLPDEVPTDAWTEYLAFEQRALNADETCRADKYLEGLSLLAPLLTDFQKNYAGQLSDNEQSWQALLSRAEEKGYNAKTPTASADGPS